MPEPHDFTVRSNPSPPKASPGKASFVCVLLIAHGPRLNPKTALPSHFTPNAAASIASRPYVRDDGQRPSQWDGMAGDVEVIWGRREAICFCKRNWTGQITLNSFKKLARRRNNSVLAFAQRLRPHPRVT